MSFASQPLFPRFVILILIILFQANFASSQTNCNEIKKLKIKLDNNSPEELFEKFYILQACGLDSIDCKLATTLAGMLLINRSKDNGKQEITYGDIILHFNKFKQDPLYAQVRKGFTEGQTNKSMNYEINKVIDYSTLCDTPLLKDTFDSFNNFPQYFNYKQALKCAQSKGKMLLVYFTGHTSASSHKMEEEVLTDPEILKILTDNFILVSLYVDHHGPIGKANIALQEQFGSQAQPAFYGVNNEEKAIANHIGYTTKDVFLQFLKSLVSKADAKTQ